VHSPATGVSKLRTTNSVVFSWSKGCDPNQLTMTNRWDVAQAVISLSNLHRGASKERDYQMNVPVGRLMAMVFICGLAFAPCAAAAETDADKTALQQATASCKAQVKEYAKYNETSWWQRHKMVKKCIKDALRKK